MYVTSYTWVTRFAEQFGGNYNTVSLPKLDVLPALMVDFPKTIHGL